MILPDGFLDRDREHIPALLHPQDTIAVVAEVIAETVNVIDTPSHLDPDLVPKEETTTVTEQEERGVLTLGRDRDLEGLRR